MKPSLKLIKADATSEAEVLEYVAELEKYCTDLEGYIDELEEQLGVAKVEFTPDEGTNE